MSIFSKAVRSQWESLNMLENRAAHAVAQERAYEAIPQLRQEAKAGVNLGHDVCTSASCT